MGLFDDVANSAKGALFQAADGEAQHLLAQAVAKAPGGLGGLLGKLQGGGLGDQVSSWLGDGHNLPISADQIQSALGEAHVQQIASHLGLPVEQILSGLAEHLPGIAGAQHA